MLRAVTSGRSVVAWIGAPLGGTMKTSPFWAIQRSWLRSQLSAVTSGPADTWRRLLEPDNLMKTSLVAGE